MSVRIVFGPEADEDVTAAVIWYHEQSPGLEDRFLRELDTALSYVRDRPHAFARIAEDLHQIPLAVFPYVVVYAYAGNTVEVVRVFHAKRDDRRKVPRRWK